MEKKYRFWTFPFLQHDWKTFFNSILNLKKKESDLIKYVYNLMKYTYNLTC